VSLIFVALWGVVGILLGILLVILAPWVGARLIGVDAVETVSDWYLWLGQHSMTKSAFVPRPGALDLVPKRYDSDQKADKDSSGGEPRHHYDSLSSLRSLANKPFGIAPAAVNEYVSLVLIEVAGKAQELRDREDLGPADGNTMVDGVPVDERSELVNLSAAKHVPTGDADPESGHRAQKKTEISQERFHEKMSFGQGILLIGSFVAALGVAWLAASQGGAVDSTTVTGALPLLFAAGSRADGDGGESGYFSDVNLRVAGVVTGIAAMILAIAVTGALLHGLLAGVAVIVPAVAIAVGYPVGIALFAPSLPVFLGDVLGKINWTLAQLTVGRGVIVERDTGQFEHHQIRKNDDGDSDWVCQLSDGTELEVDGSKGDFRRFGWAPLGFTAEKSDENMRTLSTDVPEAPADGGTTINLGERQGWDVQTPTDRLESDWLVTLPQLWKRCQGSGESRAVREGRDTALTNQGGDQNISFIVFSVLVIVNMILGGVLGLIAGGALL